MEPDMEAQRESLLVQIADDYLQCAVETGLSAPSLAVKKALREVPRQHFVPASLMDSAYANYPLPIGEGQTISQPFIVALMTDLLQLDQGSRVLEIGTGCGYQAAVLSRLAREVYSVEIIPALYQTAKQRLAALGYDNIHLRLGDGNDGWPEQAPFDGILVAAAANKLPDALLAQLAPGRRMVIPVRILPGYEVLQVIQKNAEGTITSKDTIGVRFVPLVSQ